MHHGILPELERGREGAKRHGRSSCQIMPLKETASAQGVGATKSECVQRISPKSARIRAF